MRTKLLLMAAALLVPMSLPAIAADALRPVIVPARPAVLELTGFYFGLHGGAGLGTKTWVQPSGSGGTTGLVDAQGAINGTLFGGQVGFNVMMAPGSFAGVEADASFADIKGGFPCFDGFHQLIQEDSADSCHAKADMLATLVGRVGGTVGNAWVYFLGGGAWVRDQFQDDYFFPGFCSTDFCATYRATQNRFGWTIGAGVEYAFAGNWSGKVQYNFMDFGTKRTTMAAATGDQNLGCPCHYDEDITQTIHTIKFGLNYRFH